MASTAARGEGTDEEDDESAPLSPTKSKETKYKSFSAAADRRGAEVQQDLQKENLDEVDPFTFKPAFTLCDKILVAINALWLFPIRLIFILLPSLVLGTIVCASSSFCERYDPDNPTPRARWRRTYADRVAPLVDRVFLFAFGFHWIRYKGRPASTEEAPIIVLAPHSSLLDSFAVSLYGVPTFVARDDVRNLRIFGPIMAKALRTIFVKRDDPDSKMKAAREIQRRASSGGVWPKILLFPEGTTENKKLLLSFKKGAFLPKLPVQPFLIKYGNRLSTTTWGRSGWNQVIGLFYTICQFHNSLELEFLPVYRPSEEEKEDTGLYAENVRKLISSKLGIPPGVQCLEDNIFMNQALRHGLPFESGLVIYNRISKDEGVTFAEIMSFLARFAAMDGNKDGWIRPEDMASFLSVPNDACLKALFWTTDKGSGERLSFKQYLHGFVARAKPFLADEAFLISIFNFFDKDGDGFVSMSDISHVLPIGKLPQAPQLREVQVRKRRGQSPKEEEASLHSNEAQHVTFEEEMESTIDFGQFKDMMKSNPEYLLLFHECQNAGLSSPTTPTSSPVPTPAPTASPVLVPAALTDQQDKQRVVIEIKEVEVEIV